MEDRLTRLEQVHHDCPKDIPVDDSLRRARAHVERLALYSVVWKWVPSTYYGWNLQQRAESLTGSATHTAHLCKSLVLENKKLQNGDPLMDVSTNPRYVLVICQYAATLNNAKLTAAVRHLRPIHDRLNVNRLDFRIADDNDAITGYAHNSVTPFGLLQQDKVHIILTREAVALKWFWMGGGHVDLKLRVATSEFVDKMPHVTVADVSDPREGAEDLEA